MARLEDWNKYINLLHEHALVEHDLREAADNPHFYSDTTDLAKQILFERFTG